MISVLPNDVRPNLPPSSSSSSSSHHYPSMSTHSRSSDRLRESANYHGNTSSRRTASGSLASHPSSRQPSINNANTQYAANAVTTPTANTTASQAILTSSSRPANILPPANSTEIDTDAEAAIANSHSLASSNASMMEQDQPFSPQLLPTVRSSLSVSGELFPIGSSPVTVKVKSLQHIQSFASSEGLQALYRDNNKATARKKWEAMQAFEISEMPIEDIIEMVAGLIAKIIMQNDARFRMAQRDRVPLGPAGEPQLHAILSFHGKNIPSIDVLTYLLRINKYCPTTYDVFLSLLVYFDRMAGSLNHDTSLQAMAPGVSSPNAHNHANHRPSNSIATACETGTPSVTAIATEPDFDAADLVDDDDDEDEESDDSSDDEDDEFLGSRRGALTFAVDSFNVHRLVIAGVCCSSKFFSDVFYTNSRYAKVGGLPAQELNHLELQFLLLNDFKLHVTVDELEEYASRLVRFYAEEMLTHHHH